MRKRRQRRFVFHANSTEWKAARSARRYAFFSRAGQDYHQGACLDRVASILHFEAAAAQDYVSGQCHGMTVWWLYLMKKREEAMLYGLVKRIVHCPLEKETQIADLAHFFYKMTYKKQNPLLFSDNRVTYRQLGALLGSKQQETYDGKYNADTLAQFFADRKQEDNQFCLCDADRLVLHTVGVYVRDNLFYLYDVNHAQGVAQLFADPYRLAEAIFTALDLKGTPSVQISTVYGNPKDAKLVPPPPAPPSWIVNLYRFFWPRQATDVLPSHSLAQRHSRV